MTLKRQLNFTINLVALGLFFVNFAFAQMVSGGQIDAGNFDRDVSEEDLRTQMEAAQDLRFEQLYDQVIELIETDEQKYNEILGKGLIVEIKKEENKQKAIEMFNEGIEMRMNIE